MNRKSNVNKGTLVPARFFTKLNYAADCIDATTTISMSAWQYAANGMYDPDLTGTGHQPLGYDQMATLYNDYRVHGVTVKVTGYVKTANQAAYLFLGSQGGSGLPLSVAAALENGRYVHKIGTSDKPIVIRKYFPIHQVFGKSKKVFQADAGAAAGIGANPTDLLGYINILAINIDQSTSTDVCIRTELTYHCEFNDRKVLATS